MHDLGVFLFLYKFPIIAGLFAAVALSQLGCILAARERAVQTLVLSQSSSFGALLGIAISLSYFPEQNFTSLAFGLAIMTATVVYFQSEQLIAAHYVSKSSFFIFLYLALLSCSHMISAAIPALESHMSRFIFGDLATMNDSEAWVTIAFSGLVFVYLSSQRQISVRMAFKEIVLSLRAENREEAKNERIFKLIFLIYVSLVTQTLGLLFTMSLLFIPTTMALLSQRTVSLRRHQSLAARLALTGTLIGILTSLIFTQLPTVPTVAVMTIALGFFISWV